MPRNKDFPPIDGGRRRLPRSGWFLDERPSQAEKRYVNKAERHNTHEEDRKLEKGCKK